MPKAAVQAKTKVTLSRKAKRRILQPGYWGQLEDAELEFIRSKLENNQDLSVAWGFRPVQKSRSPEAIRRVAMWGDPEDPTVNSRLVRRRPRLKGLRE